MGQAISKLAKLQQVFLKSAGSNLKKQKTIIVWRQTLKKIDMPGGLILPKQRKFLEELFEDTTLVLSTKRSEQCSVNIHGHFYLCPKKWNDGQTPNEEDLLGSKSGKTETGEPLAHFHVTWADLRWVNIEKQRNLRISTDFRLRLCRDKSTKTEEIYFYINDGPIIRKVIENAKLDGEGWVAF